MEESAILRLSAECYPTLISVSALLCEDAKRAKYAKVQTAFQYAGSLTGASVDECMTFSLRIPNGLAQCLAVKLITSFLLSYPFAGALKRIPDAKPYQKNLFIIAYTNVIDPLRQNV